MLIRLSQGQFNLLSACPRKFQYTYLDQLAAPIAPEQQERLNWGQRFHLLMQQQELGLVMNPAIDLARDAAIDSAIDPARDRVTFEHDLESDDPIQRQVNALLQTHPDLFQPRSDGQRYSEHRRSIDQQGYQLTAIYDLLILSPPQAHILDWKTYPRPQTSRWLAQNWQTRLYLYLLVETSDYLPEQVDMTYWFVQAQPIAAGSAASSEPLRSPESLRFTYSTDRHEQTRQALTQWLDRLTLWLEQYQNGVAMPQVPMTTGLCSSCDFAVRCQRQSLAPVPLAIEAIEEVAWGKD